MVSHFNIPSFKLTRTYKPSRTIPASATMAERQIPVAKELYPYEPRRHDRIKVIPVYFNDDEVTLCSNDETSNAIFVESSVYREWNFVMVKFLADLCKKFTCTPSECHKSNYNGGWMISLPARIDRYAVQKYFAGIGHLGVRAFESAGVALFRGRPISFKVSLTLHNIPPDMWSKQMALKLLSNLGTLHKIQEIDDTDDRRNGIWAIVLTHDVYRIPHYLPMHFGPSWAMVRVTVSEWDYFPDDIAPESLRHLPSMGKNVDGSFGDDYSARRSMCHGAYRLLRYWRVHDHDYIDNFTPEKCVNFKPNYACESESEIGDDAMN